MNTYLTIITTVLVLTQIIRLAQNYKHLKYVESIDDHNALILRVYLKLEKWLDKQEDKK